MPFELQKTRTTSQNMSSPCPHTLPRPRIHHSRRATLTHFLPRRSRRWTSTYSQPQTPFWCRVKTVTHRTVLSNVADTLLPLPVPSAPLTLAYSKTGRQLVAGIFTKRYLSREAISIAPPSPLMGNPSLPAQVTAKSHCGTCKPARISLGR